MFLAGFGWSLVSGFMLWMTISEIRNPKSKPWWVACNAAVLTLFAVGTVGIVAVIPNK
jgi:hypothetical protein